MRRERARGALYAVLDIEHLGLCQLPHQPVRHGVNALGPCTGRAVPWLTRAHRRGTSSSASTVPLSLGGVPLALVHLVESFCTEP